MALPGHITGAGTQENPYMLTCWNDLYEIKNEGSYQKYYKFIDGVQENLDNLYPLGSIPEVVLGDNSLNVGTYQDSNTYAAEIDFNGATFINGKFDGFYLSTVRSSDNVDLAKIVLKNLNLINVGDTGVYYGLFHYNDMDSTTELLCPITLDSCRFVIEGLSTNSGFLQRAFISIYTGYSYIKRCNITLKGTEILGASWNISDSIIFFDDVLLDKSHEVTHYISTAAFDVTEFALMRPVTMASNSNWSGKKVLAPALTDCTVYGKVRTTLDVPTALIFSPKDRVIFDIECDNLLLYRSETAVAYNSDKTAQPVISASKDIIYNSEYTIANLYPLTSDEIQDLNKLYEIGFPVKIPIEGA